MLKYLFPLLLLSSVALAKDNCSSDIQGILSSLDESGYQILIKMDDDDKTITHKIGFSMETNKIVALTQNLKKNLICVDFIGTNPYGNGEIFKKFILHQHMDETQRELDAHHGMNKHDNKSGD